MRIALVGLAGALGALSRYAIGVGIGVRSFPFATLLINVAGSFVLGVLVARVWPMAPEWLRHGLGTGLLGSFTTFSAVAASVVELTVFGQQAMAALYLGLTLIAGIGAALLGLRLGLRPGVGRAGRDVAEIGPDE